MRRLLVVLGLALAACPYVPQGDIRAEDGGLPIRPGATTAFSLYCDYLFEGWELVSGPGRCGYDWRVQDVRGGSAEYGTIDSCGLYTAPLQRPPLPPFVSANECEWGRECTDACGGGRLLELTAYP